MTTFIKRISIYAIALSMCAICFCGFGFAGDTLKAKPIATYGVDGTIEVLNTIEYTGTISAMAIKVDLPNNVEFVSVAGDYPPAIQPAKGDTGLLEFLWITTPPSPFVFTYTVATFDGAKGEINADVNYRREAGPLYTTIAPVKVGK
jgi:hypothetical protein